MPDDPAFIRMIAARPDDDAPRLVYADVLDETGDPAKVARAEFIRVQVERARQVPDSPRWRELWYRDTALLDWARQWRAELPAIAGGCYGGFIRGFIDEARLDGRDLPAHLATVIDRLPLRRLVVNVADRFDVRGMARCPALEDVRDLEVASTEVFATVDVVRALADRGPWPLLRRLKVPWWVLMDDTPRIPRDVLEARARALAAFGDRLDC